MKYILLFISIGFSIQLKAQHDIKPTEQFTIEGLVKSPFTFHLKDAAGYSSKKIDSVVITNHLKQPRGSIKNLRAILLKDILAKVELAESNPKLLSEFYFVVTASDNYKVIFSWNEIFNTATGNSIYIIIEGIPDRIALISPGDEATGRRFVKGLQKIVVKRAE